MRLEFPSRRQSIIGVAVLTSMAATFWAGYHFGYRAGLSDQCEQEVTLGGQLSHALGP